MAELLKGLENLLVHNGEKWLEANILSDFPHFQFFFLMKA